MSVLYSAATPFDVQETSILVGDRSLTPSLIVTAEQIVEVQEEVESRAVIGECGEQRTRSSMEVPSQAT